VIFRVLRLVVGIERFLWYLLGICFGENGLKNDFLTQKTSPVIF
jgi:hypothetical protein